MNCVSKSIIGAFQQSSEEICALIGQCFHLVYTEATMQFLDSKLFEAAHSMSVSSSNITTTTATSRSGKTLSTAYNWWEKVGRGEDLRKSSPKYFIRNVDNPCP